MSARLAVRAMIRGIVEAPILMLFAISAPFLLLQWYGLDLWTTAGTPMFISGALFVISGLVGIEIAKKISFKLLGPDSEGSVEVIETLAEKRP